MPLTFLGMGRVGSERALGQRGAGAGSQKSGKCTSHWSRMWAAHQQNLLKSLVKSSFLSFNLFNKHVKRKKCKSICCVPDPGISLHRCKIPLHPFCEEAVYPLVQMWKTSLAGLQQLGVASPCIRAPTHLSGPHAACESGSRSCENLQEGKKAYAEPTFKHSECWEPFN